MDTKPYSRIMEERLIERFKKEFFQKTGKLLKVQDYEPKLPYPIVSLHDLEYICNQFIPVGYQSIKDDFRRKDIVYARMLFCNLAYSMGYPIKRIADHVERDRSSVYSAISTYDDLMQSNESFCTTLYRDVVNQLNNSYNESTTSAMHDASDYSESAVPAALL
jgi:hypothetical protein